MLKKLLADKDVKREITTFDYKDLDIGLINLSTRNDVELFVKDFAKSYEHILTVYQNDVGYFERVIFVNY